MPTKYLPQLFLKVAGAKVSEEIMDDIISVEVDQSLHLPDMFTINLRDEFTGSGCKWMDGNTFDLGKLVEISIEPGDGGERNELFNGEITAIEPEFDPEDGATLLIRGHNKLHRLHRGTKTRSFQEQTDSQIVTKLAGECGLSADVESTRPSHEHVIQYNQTDMEFIQDMARRNGYFVYVDRGKLIFRSKPVSRGSGPVLKWGENLQELQARMTTAEQVERAEVHGWDAKKKVAIDAKAASPSIKPGISGESHGGKAAKKAFGRESIEVVINHPVNTTDEAKAIAQSVINEKCNAFLQAEGTCDGNTAVRAGTTVEINGVGAKFSGKHLLTRSIHRYDSDGYNTRFEISGYRANTLGQILSNNHKDSKGYGVVTGQVTNLNDPDNLGRVKVKYPGISNQLESHWARLVNPMAGAERGFYFLPEIDDEVLIAFEHGDINHPYIVGALWSSKDKPPLPNNEAVASGKVNKRMIKSRSGHTITIDDTSGKEKISIIDKTKNNLISEADITIEGKANLTLKGKTVSIEATQGGDMALKAKNLNLQANSKAELKGNSGVDVNGGAQVNIKSTGATKVEGTQTSISGTAMTEIKGAIVKIN
jgi:uncharacterized protein involved in type VI secretion and phage assembly